MSHFPPGRKQIEWYAVTVKNQPLSEEEVWREILALEDARVARWSGTRPLSLTAGLVAGLGLDRDQFECLKAVPREPPVAWASIEGWRGADGDG